jgi:5-dehydro-2-deoxygluconokinase
MEFAMDCARPLAAIVVGRAGMDLYPLPDGAKTEEAEEFAAEIGGSAGNIAVALSRQGYASALLGAFSNDSVGRFVRAHLERNSVDTSRCRAVTGQYRTSLAICETRSGDSETVFYRNGAVDLQLRSDDFDRAFIASAAVLIVTGTALAADPSRAAAIQALETARAENTFAILDIDHRPVSWPSDAEASRIYTDAVRRADAVVGNDEEFAVIAGGAKDALAAAADLAKRGCKFTIFKQGRHGSITLTRDRSFETGIFPVEVKKPFGAGDAFMGGLVASLLAGGSLELAVQRASAAAAHVVSRRGCAFAMPSKAELDLFIESHSLTRELAHAHSTLR